MLRRVTYAFGIITYDPAATLPTVHCNKLRDPVEIQKKLLFHRKLRPALKQLAN